MAQLAASSGTAPLPGPVSENKRWSFRLDSSNYGAQSFFPEKV
jgi:hypothetical protein